MTNRFHISLPVSNLHAASEFYRRVLECQPGRAGPGWADFNFFGHQLSLHEMPLQDMQTTAIVDDVTVPIPHYGVALTMDEWVMLIDDLVAKRVKFIVEPTVRFAGLPGEQGTAFFSDPSNNVIEVKGFSALSTLFDK